MPNMGELEPLKVKLWGTKFDSAVRHCTSLMTGLVGERSCCAGEVAAGVNDHLLLVRRHRGRAGGFCAFSLR